VQESSQSGAEPRSLARQAPLPTTATSRPTPRVGQQAQAPSQTCEDVPLPRPLRANPLPTLEPLGRTETTRVNQFTDDYLYSPSGEFKIGTRREWGSTIIFFGESGDRPGVNSTNTIDSNDTGREVQVALYDYKRGEQGCAWNASCLKAPETGCGKEITYLGWNPVQGGDECNRGSGTESVAMSPGRIRAKVRPRFWNPDWQLENCGNVFCNLPVDLDNRSDVLYLQQLRFVDSHAVELWMEYTNLSDIDHAPAFQEFPTIYSSFGKLGPDLWVVLDSAGNQIAVDLPSNDSFFRKSFFSPGGFAALQNSQLDYGVGLYYESRQRRYQAWQRRGQFNNFRAQFKFGLPALGKVRARAYLLIGSFETIASTVAQLERRIGPFGDLDSPLPDAVVGKKLKVRGWALDNWEVSSIELRLDGRTLAKTTLTDSRPDVCTLWPGYEMCDQVGFTIEADLSDVSRCPHLLEVLARDNDGNVRPIARQRIFVKNKPPCTGPGCDADSASTHPIYRFSWSRGQDRDHQFSRTNEAPPDYTSEGEAFKLFSNPGRRMVPLWQSWCEPCTDHLQARDSAEGAPVYTDPVLLGYCSAVPTGQAPRELRRLYSVEASDHYVSADPAEWNSAAGQGYVGEGRCWVP
jgi:hypothetical protein